MSNIQTEAPDDHFVRVDSRSGLPPHKPLINVQIDKSSSNDTPDYPEQDNRYASGSATVPRSVSDRQSWFSKEPISITQKMEALLVNTYVEIFSTVIASFTVFNPNYFSFATALVTYIVFIAIPVHMIKNQSLRLKITDIASKVMFVIITMIIFIKLFLIEESTGESFGVYMKTVTDEDTGLSSQETDIFGTFIFEIVALSSYATIYYVTHLIKIRSLLQSADEPLTYLGCRYFGSKRRIFKYLFVSLTLIEILNMPDLLALPVLYSFLALMVFSLIRVSKRKKQSQRSTFMDSNYFAVTGQKGLTNWAMEKENLFRKMLTWQKACMMLQLFEFIVTHIDQVRNSIINGNTHDENHLSTILFLLRCVGHTEYQTAEPLPNYVIAYQMAMTILSIFFAQCCEKTYQMHIDTEANFDLDKELRFSNTQGRIASFISRRKELKKMKSSLDGFAPVILNWLVRIAIAVFAYMYNSYVGFYHLVWVMTSFLVPLKIFYAVSVVILFPVVLTEFSLVYVANIKTFNNAKVYNHSILHEFQFHPMNLTLEMCLMYSIVVLVGLMIPARLRFLSYESRHRGSDMTKDMIVANLKDKDSSVLWKFFFIIIINIHTPVLFLMLFMGNSNFNLFQLGFMFFFVVYGSSQWLYYKTSIILPVFISYFILSQYFWSLVYHKYSNYNNNRDFLYMIDGWEPPADINDFYWTRMPNLQLWGLLFVMQVLHSISQQFPDKEQNFKYAEECDKQISEKFPTISKWIKRIWNFLFMIVLVTVLFLLARDLIRQKSNIINLIYLILFTITFGKMCSTSLDGNSFKRCIIFARLIKVYSAFVLIMLVTYHLLVFEFYNLDEWLKVKRQERNFFVLNIEIFGFGLEESSTKVSVQLYTAYLIVGQILESSFQQSIKKQEKRDLFNWSEALKTPVGVARAANFFRYDNLFLVYKFFTYWPALDFFCTYFHVLNNGIIVYFSVTVSISLFFAIHLSLIVFFYCYSSFKMHQATKDKGQHDYDLQQATDACRKYKKLSADLFLKLRQRLWMTQYAITLAFMFAGYFDEIIDTVLQHADDPVLIENLKTVQFYMYWTGIYQPNNTERRIEGLMPIHIMFLIILFEKQAQNWLYSRWGLNKTLITKFAHLEFYLKIDKKGKEWLPQAEEGKEPFKEIRSQEIMPKADNLDELPQLQGQRWLMEQFNTYMIFVWKNVKTQSILKAALQAGIQQKFYKASLQSAKESESVHSKLANDEYIDTMTLKELTILEKELSKKLAIDLDLCSHFQNIKLVIENEDCVLYLPVKEIVLDQMKKWNLIDLERVPFLSYSIVSSHRRSIHQKLNDQFLQSALKYNAKFGIDINERVESKKQDHRLNHLRRELMKIVNRRYSYEMWGGLRLLFQQMSLMLLLFNVIIKCNIVSLIYLILVTNYLLRHSKPRAMRNMVYIIGAIFILQYWIYLMNLTSQSSPTPFPEEPYPNQQYPQGKYLIPIMYKLEFGRVMQNAYWYSFGVEIYSVRTLWVDFITLVLVSVYLFYYRNPVLAAHSGGFLWCRMCKNIGGANVCQCLEESDINNQANDIQQPAPLSEDQDTIKQIDFCKNLSEYHTLMVLKHPSETEYSDNKERLRELLDNCQYYLIVEGSQILIFTTMHIFTMIVILLMALCRRSLVSIGYVVALAPCLWASANVLKQHENYVKCERELKEKKADPDFQKFPDSQQRDILKYIQQKYEWSFIKRICIYLSIYSYIDYVTQVTFQIPYIPNYEVLEHFGLRKIYPPHDSSFDYSAFVSGNYDAPKLNMSNLIMQILNCVIVCIISTQSELFKSQGFKAFITVPDQGLDLLMKLSELKKWAITYDYNNQKLTKILLIQKTEQQIFGTVERLRLNAELWRKSQQRAMLEEYCHKFGGMYIPPNPTPPLEEQMIEEIRKSEAQTERTELSESQILELENLRREKLVTEQTVNVTSKLLPYRASIYLSLMKLGQSYIFFNRREDMERIKEEMQCGQQNNGIDLIRIIRSDLFSLLNKFESESGKQLEVWPKLILEDLRQTNSYCKWPNMISRQIAALFRAIISNTALISYICMLMSLYTNAGLVALLYPFVVFGYALLEETRPGKTFWRAILAYSLSVLFLKYVINLNIIHTTLSETNWNMIDGFVKFGLHHLETTKDLVWHMLPEMLIVMSILCHEIVEQFTGLFEQSESQIEDVPAAIARIFNKSSRNKQTPTPENQDQRSVTQVSIIPANFTEQVAAQQPPVREHSSEIQPILSRASLYVSMDKTLAEREVKLINSEAKDQSQEVHQQLALKLNEIKSVDELSAMEFNRPIEFELNETKRQTSPHIEWPENELRTMDQRQSIDREVEKKSFWTSPYMQRIFPKVQQQKPGTDYYLFQTTVQIYITYYLINNFNIFSATSPYLEQNLFSAEMTIVLFYQLLCIILERIIARTENRKRVEKFKQTADAIKPHIKPEQLFMPVQHNDLTVQLVIQKLKFQHLADQQHVEALSKLRYQQDCEIIESESLVTIQQKAKFILHWVNMIIVHLYIFWYMPIQANITLYGEPNCGDTPIHGCKDFRVNESLKTFYLCYLLFFYLSARQISQGLPSFRRGSSTMYYEGGERDDTEEDIFNALHQVFINFPLAVEMRCLLDFTFTKTSIDLWQTCELFQYNSDFFIAKTSTLSYNRKVLGKEVSKFSKICFGYICTTIMLSFILGPFLMFSSIGGMTLYNPVVYNDLQFWVQVNVTSTRTEGNGNETLVSTDSQVVPFKLYDNESPSIYDFNEVMFKKRHFDQWPETKFFEPSQLQLIVPTYFSDTTWIASDSQRAFLQKYACIANLQSISDEEVPEGCNIHRESQTLSNVTIGFQLKTLFKRNGPQTAKDAFGMQQRNLNTDDPYDRVLLSQFSMMLSEKCTNSGHKSYTMNITSFFYPKLLLGETTTVEPIYFNTRESAEQAKRNLLLTYQCKDQWAIGTGSSANEETGSLEFTVFSQKIVTDFLQGYNIGSFYTGLVLLIGMYMRPIFIFNTNRAFIYEINYADPMLRLCESIHLSRARGDLKSEEENFRLLQEILRSPELLHSLTGSNLKGGDYAPPPEERKAHLIPKAYGSQPVP